MNVSFTLSVDEANQILGALGKLPYEQSAALIMKIKTEAERQIAEKQKAEKQKAAAEPKE